MSNKEKQVLDPEQVRWARARYAEGGITIQAIADSLGVAYHRAQGMLNGDTYVSPIYGEPVKTHHARGSQHPKAKLTDEQAFSIMQDYVPMWGGIAQLARRFNVDPSAILQVLRRITFKHVQPPESFKGYTAVFQPKPSELLDEILAAAEPFGSIAAAARKIGINTRRAQAIVQRHRLVPQKKKSPKAPGTGTKG